MCQTPAGSGGHNHHKTAHNTEHSDDVPSVVKDIALVAGADNMADSNKQEPDYPHNGDNCVKHHEQVADNGVAAGCQGICDHVAKNGDQCLARQVIRIGGGAHNVLIGDECLCRYGSQRQTRTQCSGYDFHGNSGTEGMQGISLRNEEKELQTGRSVLPVGNGQPCGLFPAVPGLQVIGEGALFVLADPPFIQLPEAV